MEFSKTIKNTISHLYNAMGDDAFLIQQTIKNLKAQIISNFEEFDFIKLDGDISSEVLNTQLATLPLGNEYRLIVINEPKSEICKFLDSFDFNDYNVVLCINAENLKNAETIDCKKLDRIDLSKYILNYISKFDLSIEEVALDYLINSTESNMMKIYNELNKITNYCEQGTKIDMEVVVNLVSNSNEYAIFSLTNAIDDKDYTSYCEALKNLSFNFDYNELFSYLGKYFKRMQYISVNKNDDELSKILNIKPYAIKISRKNIAKNGVKFYIDLYEKYIDLDYKIKSGKISSENALYELVF